MRSGSCLFHQLPKFVLAFKYFNGRSGSAIGEVTATRSSVKLA